MPPSVAPSPFPPSSKRGRNSSSALPLDGVVEALNPTRLFFAVLPVRLCIDGVWTESSLSVCLTVGLPRLPLSSLVVAVVVVALARGTTTDRDFYLQTLYFWLWASSSSSSSSSSPFFSSTRSAYPQPESPAFATRGVRLYSMRLAMLCRNRQPAFFSLSSTCSHELTASTPTVWTDRQAGGAFGAAGGRAVQHKQWQRTCSR
ncbi:uncharacterized protein J3D65DRAFT_273230 [Phyllosticta citribraziliensis]|uniref:Uncharacterized protein n=1 Tax=Phyllosticta citribraziliensis TaxID=989973 RepID=A0ABR1M341_9PEZI